MTANEIMSAITLGAVVIGAVVNLTSLVGKREAKAAAEARLEAKLDTIYNKVDNIEKKQNNIEYTLQQHAERITIVEQSAKSAHHRIDAIEKREIKS